MNVTIEQLQIVVDELKAQNEVLRAELTAERERAQHWMDKHDKASMRLHKAEAERDASDELLHKVGMVVCELTNERDALRAQAAEKDAALEKMDGDARWTISDVQHDLTDMRLRAEAAEAERDALRALLREARPYVNSIPAANRRETIWVDLLARIEAALKETP